MKECGEARQRMQEKEKMKGQRCRRKGEKDCAWPRIEPGPKHTTGPSRCRFGPEAKDPTDLAQSTMGGPILNSGGVAISSMVL